MVKANSLEKGLFKTAGQGQRLFQKRIIWVCSRLRSERRKIR